MTNILGKPFIWIVVIGSILIWGLLAVIHRETGSMVNLLLLIPEVVALDVMIALVFAQWGWKWKIFRNRLVPFPDLNGTWTGYIYSTWEDPKTGQKPGPIPVMLTVKQDFLNLSCVMRISEMVSRSYSEGFNIDPNRQQKALSYNYSSQPKLPLTERSAPHDGSAVFEIIETPSLKLNGKYWTERKTTGEIKLEFHGREMLEELPLELGEHPVTEDKHRH